MRSSGTVVAVVPARAGSKGIPGKNLRPVGGRSLVRRAVEAALRTETIDTVVVSTDGDAIAAEASAAGSRVVRRPAELAGDEASSESALLHALDALLADPGRDGDPAQDPQVLVFLQATSPFIDPADLDAAVRRVLDGHADVVLAATPSHAFLWRIAEDGSAAAVNHDAAVRPRRQDREAEYRETGAFTVMRTSGFREHRHRFFGRVELAVVDPRGAIDVDDPSDLALASSLAHILDRPTARPTTPRTAPSQSGTPTEPGTEPEPGSEPGTEPEPGTATGNGSEPGPGTATGNGSEPGPGIEPGTARWPLAATTDPIPHPSQQNGTP